MNKNCPLISIVTVVFNGEKHIEQTIQSVINQSYKNIEYLIIDGNSTDNTVDIIKKYEAKINFWISEPDKGIYDAMNKGIQLAKGEFIGMINSDDYYEKNAVEIIANKIKKQPETDIFFGNMFLVNHYIEKKQLQTYKKGKSLEKTFSIWHPTVFVKKTAYEKYGYFNLAYRIAADYELLLRFYKKNCKFQYINKAISTFREGGISYYNKKLLKERFNLQLEHTNFWNAYLNRLKFKTIEILQKIFIFILGEKRYHNLRYKYLWKGKEQK